MKPHQNGELHRLCHVVGAFRRGRVESAPLTSAKLTAAKRLPTEIHSYAYQFHRRDRRWSRRRSFDRQIKAATAWHASGAKPESGDWKTIALRNLIQTAEDFEADAIIRVDYEVDGVEASDLAPVSLQRVAATGIAVKLSRSKRLNSFSLRTAHSARCLAIPCRGSEPTRVDLRFHAARKRLLQWLRVPPTLQVVLGAGRKSPPAVCSSCCEPASAFR